MNDRSGDEGKELQIFKCTQKTRTSQESRITRTVPHHRNPGYQKRNRLRMSPILHPTNFADFATSQSSALLNAMIMKQPVHKIIMASIQIITTAFHKEASNSLKKKKDKNTFSCKEAGKIKLHI